MYENIYKIIFTEKLTENKKYNVLSYNCTKNIVYGLVVVTWRKNQLFRTKDLRIDKTKFLYKIFIGNITKKIKNLKEIK